MTTNTQEISFLRCWTSFSPTEAFMSWRYAAHHINGYSKTEQCLICLPPEKSSNCSDSFCFVKDSLHFRNETCFTLLITVKKLKLTLETTEIHRIFILPVMSMLLEKNPHTIYNWDSNFKVVNEWSLSDHKIQTPFPNTSLLFRKKSREITLK